MAFFYPNKYFLNPSKSVPMGMDFFCRSNKADKRSGTSTETPRVDSTVGKNLA